MTLPETFQRIEDLAHQLEVTRRALFQAQEAHKKATCSNDFRANVLGRIAELALGESNNVDDEAVVRAVARLSAIQKAAQALADEAQEYAMDFGLGCAAPLDLWEGLWEALDPDPADAASVNRSYGCNPLGACREPRCIDCPEIA